MVITLRSPLRGARQHGLDPGRAGRYAYRDGLAGRGFGRVMALEGGEHL